MPADFAEFAKGVHGFDVSAPPQSMPKLVFDTKAYKSDFRINW